MRKHRMRQEYISLNDTSHKNIESENAYKKYKQLNNEAKKYEQNCKDIKMQIKEYEKVIKNLEKKIDHLNKSYENCLIKTKELNDEALIWNKKHKEFTKKREEDISYEDVVYVNSFLNEQDGYIVPMYDMSTIDRIYDFEEKYPYIDEFEYFDNFELIK